MTRRHMDTSTAAYASILSATSRLERIVLQVLHENPNGLTVDEVCAVAEYPRYSLQPRFSALRDRKAIYDTGKRRPSVSGAMAAVWRATALDEQEGIA